MRVLKGMKLVLALGLLFAASVTWALRAPVSSQQEFIAAAGAQALADVEYGRLAAQRAQAPALRELAARTVSLSGINVLYLRDCAASAHLPFPRELNAAQRRDLERLRELPAADFDRAYLQLLIAGTEHKIELFEAQASQDTIDELQQYAFRHFPELHDQLVAAEQLLLRRTPEDFEYNTLIGVRT